MQPVVLAPKNRSSAHPLSSAYPLSPPLSPRLLLPWHVYRVIIFHFAVAGVLATTQFIVGAITLTLQIFLFSFLMG